MKNKIHVTVVTPTYNSEKFIHILLDSLVRQTLSQDNLEVIIVNDHSTDGTVKVLQKYKKKIKNLRILETECNTGNPIAGRNIGIEEAKGEYIHFVDHDDYLGDEALERLYGAAVEWKSDVIFGKQIPVIDDAPVDRTQAIFRGKNISSVDPFLNVNIVSFLAPHRMFRRQFIMDNNIRYDPEVRHGEDVFFVMTSFVNASTISVLTDYVFYYRTERTDGGNLTNHQKSHHDYQTRNYKTKRIFEEIDRCELGDDYKVQWKKLYLERYLGYKGHAGHILTPRVDLGRMDVINRYVLAPAGDEVFARLDPMFRLIIDMARLRESPKRDLLLGSMLCPRPEDVRRVKNRLYIQTYTGDLYDASLLYRALNVRINKFTVEEGKLLAVLRIRHNIVFEKGLSYELKFEHRETGAIATKTVSKRKSGDRYIFALNAGKMIATAGDKPANYTVTLLIKGDYINLAYPLFSSDMKEYSEARIVTNQHGFRVRRLTDDTLVTIFTKRKTGRIRSLFRGL